MGILFPQGNHSACVIDVKFLNSELCIANVNTGM